MRSAIVTGAASGIGLATARALIRDGWDVLAADIDADGVAAHLGEECRTAGVDISSADSVRDLFALAARTDAPLGAVANVAGISLISDQRFEDSTEDDFDRTLAVNVRGTYLMCRNAIAPLRAAGGGAIVNMGSVASIKGLGGTAYITSKHALVGLTRSIAFQYAEEGIRCTLVAPGATRTPMLDIAAQKSTSNMGVRGTVPGSADPSEIAGLVAFLLSDAARFITGSTHAIDGGVTAH